MSGHPQFPGTETPAGLPQGEVFLVGQGFRHHARHSGYGLFCRHIGSRLRPPLGFRYLPSRRLNESFSRLAGHPLYAPGALVMETAAIAHMLLRRRGLYHVLYGEADLLLLRRIRRPARVRLAASFHEPLEILERLGDGRRLVQSLDAAILMSESQRPFFCRLLPESRIFVVPHGVDTEFFQPPVRLAAEPVCITAGEHHRDFETLWNAVRLLHRDHPRLRWIAVGASRPRHGAPFAHPAVRFVHGVNDQELRRLYQESRVAVFCFRSMTGSNALLEAMACGLPVVSTDVGGVRESLGTDAGVLCPPGDPAAVAEAVRCLLSNDSAAREMGAAARRRAFRFDFKRVAGEMGQVYSKIFALGPP